MLKCILIASRDMGLSEFVRDSDHLRNSQRELNTGGALENVGLR